MSLSIDIQYQLTSTQLAINCQFPSQGISGIFGPSGVGKTTLLRLIAGLDQPQTGLITFNQTLWFDNKCCVTPKLRRVGFVFQDSRLFPHLNVQQNLRLAQQQVSKPVLDILAISDDFGISELLPQRANKLSAGQQQRVAIVRSLLAQPQLLLLDEPLAALDQHSKQSLITQLKAHSAKHQLPMIYVSHSASELDQLCHYLVMIKPDGKVEYGDSHILLQQYLQQQTTVISSDDQQHRITLSLTPQQYQRYKEQQHILISTTNES